MKARHIIKTQHLELSFHDEARAGELHSIIRDLCCDEIERAIEQSLDVFNSHDSVVYSFRQVVLDLGEIEWDDVRSQLPEKIAAELKRVLRESFLEAGSAPVVSLAPSGERDIDCLRHFLRYGYMPWNSRHHNAMALLVDMIDKSRQNLATMIREIGALASVRTRMTERFPSPVMQKVISTLEPLHAHTITSYHRHLASLNKRESIVHVPQNELEKALWLFVLNHLLAEQGSDFNRRAFTTSMLRQFSCHYNIEFTELLLLVRTGLQRWRGTIPVPFQTLVDELILQSVSFERRHEFDSSSNADPTSLQEDATLQPHSTLEDMMSHPQWKQLLAERMDDTDARWLPWIRQTKNKPTVLYKMVSQSAPKLPGRLIEKLAPVECVAITQYHTNLTTLHAVDPIPNTTRREVEDILWTFMIIHLAERQGSYFNHKSYLRTLIVSFSAHYNMQAADLLARLLASGTNLQGASTSMNQFLSILVDIQGEMSPQATGKTLPRQSSTNSLSFETLIQQWIQQPPPANRQLLENKLVQGLQTHRQWAHQLTVSLSDVTFKERLATVSRASFKQLMGPLISPSAVDLFKQFVHLTELLESQLSDAFGTVSHYQQAVHLGILDVISATHALSVSHDQLYKLLLKSLVARASRLKLRHVQACAAMHRDDSRVSLLKKFLRPDNHQDLFTGTPADTLAKQLIDATLQGHHDFLPGFSTTTEAWAFLHQHYAKALRQAFKAMSNHQRAILAERLEDEVVDMMLKHQPAVKGYPEVIGVWNNLLKGYHQRSEIMNSLRRALLLHDAWSDVPALDALSESWIRLLEKYKLPDSFYDAVATWTLPRYGDPAKAIQQIERKLTKERIAKPRVLRRAEKKRLIRETLREARKQARITTKAATAPEDVPEIFIQHAGLVLVHPYLPFLFEQCGLMTQGKFHDEASQLRALTMLQYVMTGHERSMEEEQVLGKLLCGMDIRENSVQKKLKKQEKQMANEMLNALSQHWTVINGSTPDEVRGNWLVREGRLRESEEYWELVVKRQPYDILLDSLPFTLSPVQHPWMKKMIMIQWL